MCVNRALKLVFVKALCATTGISSCIETLRMLPSATVLKIQKNGDFEVYGQVEVVYSLKPKNTTGSLSSTYSCLFKKKKK